jgi:D-3-phosphoglycerate dehydrogenase
MAPSTSLNRIAQGEHSQGACRVVIADPDIDPDTARRILDPLSVKVAFERRDWAGQDIVGVVTNSESPIQLADLVRCPDLKVAITTTTGLDHIDVAACRQRGVRVWHPADYCSDEVADTAIALLLGLLRGTILLNRDVLAGNWHFTSAGPLQRSDTTRLGILGFGTIGRKVASRAQALGMHVAAHDPGVEPNAFATAGVEQAGLESLFRISTAISIHAPLTDDTRGLVSERLLALLPAGSVLVNLARGEILDTAALLTRLDGGGLAAAALDVLAVEPPTEQAPAPRHPRLVVTPHAAWYSEQSARTVLVRPLEVMRDCLLGSAPPDLIA